MASKIKGALYDVPSFTEAGASYVVDVAAGSCTCPHYRHRLQGCGKDCKHLKAARAARFADLLTIAEEQPTETLESLLPRYEQAGRLEVAIAIRSILTDRAVAAIRC